MKKANVLLLMSFLMPLFCLFSCTNQRTPLDKNSVASANKIIDALEKFKNVKGYYPENLNALSPDIIATIPQPDWGIKKWDYGKSSYGREEYTISVRLKENDYIGYVYDSKSKSWLYNE